MTTEEYVKANLDTLHQGANTYWDEAKEGDFAHKGIAAIFAITMALASDETDETDLTDYSVVRREMENDEDHPITNMIWR